jgi:hypothetical protein
MLKNILLLVFITSSNDVLAQDNSRKLIYISGEVTGTTMENDFIYFNSAWVDKKYYETLLPSAKILTNSSCAI